MKIKLIYFFVFLLGFGAIGYGLYENNKAGVHQGGESVSQEKSIEEISYVGHEGTDALTILREEASVDAENGFVTAINGRKADASKEFWAFYVNGKQAEVGAGEYLTKDSDQIVWKIEQYK